MTKPLQTSGQKRFIDGYTDDPMKAGPNHLCPPSANMDLTKTGEAVFSKGFIPVSYDLGEDGKASRPFHVPRHNVTFFSLNGKVKFVDHGNDDAVVDTGVSLTETNGRNVRFGEYAGDVYSISRLDGLRQFHMGRVNDAAADSGDSEITVDQDLAGRLLAFGDGASTLRIAVDTPFTEAMTSVAATGVVTLTGTLNAAVPDNTIVYTVEDISSGRPFGSGLTFWKERMVVWGVVYDEAMDSATNLVYLSSFANLTALENVIDFNAANTAAKEMVGKGGTVTNVLSTRDYLYAFTETQSYYAGVEDIDLTTGGTPFQDLTSLYGCANEDCATDLGNGTGAFLTKNRRVIGIEITTPEGAPAVFPSEKFDSAISKTNALLDSDQSNSFLFYAPNEHRLYVHCDVDGTRVVQKFNTEIQRWEPPRTGWSFGGMFVKDGVTYATELTDDAVWQLGEGYQDNGIDYEKIAAIVPVEGEDGRMTLRLDSVGISGSASDLASVTVENYVANGTPQQKTFTVASGVSLGALGSVALGTTTLGSGSGTEMSPYDKLFAIYPKYGASYQLAVRSLGPFTLSSYTVMGSVLGKPLLSLQ